MESQFDPPPPLPPPPPPPPLPPLSSRISGGCVVCICVLLEVKSASLIKKLAANKQNKTHERLKQKQPEAAAKESFIWLPLDLIIKYELMWLYTNTLHKYVSTWVYWGVINNQYFHIKYDFDPTNTDRPQEEISSEQQNFNRKWIYFIFIHHPSYFFNLQNRRFKWAIK